MNTHTDTQLKQALAKMLPEMLQMRSKIIGHGELLSYHTNGQAVLDTELLHLCWLVESSLDASPHHQFQCCLVSVVLPSIYGLERAVVSATWQQRVTALAKVLNVEIK